MKRGLKRKGETMKASTMKRQRIMILSEVSVTQGLSTRTEFLHAGQRGENLRQLVLDILAKGDCGPNTRLFLDECDLGTLWQLGLI